MKRNILLIDDDRDLQELTKFILGQAGFEVRTADDGIHALDELGKGPCDLLLLDITMPGVDGLNVLEKVRADERFKKLPVVMLTASNDAGHVRSVKNFGVADYIIKPPQRADLLSRVERILGGRPRFEEVTFDDQEAIAQGHFEIPVVLKSLSDQGVVLYSPVPIDTRFLTERLNLGVFATIEIPPISLTFVDCVPADDGGYEYLLAMHNVSESSLKKIRAWIVKRALESKKAV